MPRRKTIRVPSQGGRFKGIDRRDTSTRADPDTLYDAINVDLTIGGSVRRRGGLVPFVKLPAGQTIGLYVAGNKLRVAYPAGNNIAHAIPAGVIGDAFGDSNLSATPTDRYIGVTAVEEWGSTSTGQSRPYLVLKASSGRYFHHWITEEPASGAAPINTQIVTGFNSGPGLEKLQGHMWAWDDKGLIHHSSTEFGPGVWRESDAPLDAGFINPLEHSLSDPDVRALTQHQGRLTVVFANSMQFWNVAPDPQLNSFATALRGPGTKVSDSVTPVIGDLFYFSEGGFRSLATQTVTGELREGDLGAPLDDLTQPFIGADPDSVRGLWSQARSQYLCAFNKDDGTADVFVNTFAPSVQMVGWTRWSLPLPVDYWVELDEVIYIRSGDWIYKLDPDHCWDDIDGESLSVRGTVATQFLSGGANRHLKQWQVIEVTQDGACDIVMHVDQNDRSITYDVARDLEGSTHDGGEVPIDAMAHAVAFTITADLLWELDGIDIDTIIMQGLG